jgi:RNA polymerase sigma-70 factor (ECF subfamily)
MQGKEKNIQKLAGEFIKQKSDKSFRDLFERLKPGILNHCFLIVKDPSLAEDAFLNTMSKIWQKIDQYNDERGNFSTWCYNIARNETLLLMKEEKKYNARTSLEMEFFSSNNEIGDVGGTYNMEEDQSNSFFNETNKFDEIYGSVIEEIENLPDLYKNIMIDREINNMKYKDIAEKYDLKKRSVATRIRRARNKITKNVGPESVEIITGKSRCKTNNSASKLPSEKL